MSHESRRTTKAVRWIAWAAIALSPPAVSGLLDGCASSSASTSPALAPTSTQADDEAAADVTEHHRHHHHGGVPMFIAMSIDTLNISQEQRTEVSKIEADLFARMERARASEQNLLETLADGVQAGAVDATKVKMAVTELATASGDLHDATAEALNRLHAILTAEQRAALVDKVDAHWAIWQRANSEDDKSGKGHLDALAKELNLTPDQVDKIRSNIEAATRESSVKPDPQLVESHLKAFGDAFKADAFDAKSLSTAASANAHLATWGATRMVIFCESVIPVLTADQRATFAQHLREHAQHHESSAG